MTVIPSATGNTMRQIEMIRGCGVTTIHCTPNYAMHLSEVTEDMGEALDSLKTEIFGAEPWAEIVRKALENQLGLTAFDSYGLSELFDPEVAFECPEHEDLHIWHDSYLVEIIDPRTGEQVSDGERGELADLARIQKKVVKELKDALLS